MRKINLMFFLWLFLFSCSNRKKENNVIDLESHVKKEVSFFDIFSSLEIIPLETSSQSVFFYPPRKILMHDNKFYVLGRKQYNIFVFGEDGKYLRTIDKEGRGPGEYQVLYDFNINRYSGDFELMSAYGYINIYDSVCNKFKGKINVGKKAISYFANVDSDTYVFFKSSHEEKKVFFYSKKQNKIISETYDDVPDYIYFNTPYRSLYSPLYIYNDSAFLLQQYNGRIFNILNSGNLTCRYSWNFGDLNFDISKIMPDRKRGYYIAYDKNVTPEYVSHFSCCSENSRYYFSLFLYRKQPYSLILDKDKGKLMIIKEFKEGLICAPVFCTEKAVYSLVNYQELHMTIKDKSILDEENRRIYESYKYDDNPVILKYSLK